ncbi:MAG: PIN domain-containing protein [Bryobacterales bacterium]|nr:PIN domain-containing protein [Bryobacterales bacterium]
MAENFILVDFENVQPEKLPSMEREDLHLWLFLGPNQPRIPVELAIRMQPLGVRARYVRITSPGKDALDFVIAFSIGELAVSYPSAYFHIVSKDTGFDPLVNYLRTRSIKVQRHASMESVPFWKPLQDPSVREHVTVAISHFQKTGVTRPRTRKTLFNALHALFKKTLADEEIAALVKELERRRLITLAEEKVEHHWPVANANGEASKA